MPEVLRAEPKSTDHASERDRLHDILQDLTGALGANATVVISRAAGLSPRVSSEQFHALRSIPALLYDGQTLAALSVCHELAHSDIFAQNDLRQKILELRQALESSLLIHDAAILSSDSTGIVHLLPRRKVFIGRASNEASVDVAVDCRWLSRGDRNLSLCCEGEIWSLEDLGSTNGHFAGDGRLQPGRPHPLPIGETCIRVGEDQGDAMILRFRRPAKDPGAVVISLSGTEGESDAWPGKDSDLQRRWIIFREQIGIGGADCALPLPAASAEIVAAVRYQSGFWILPSARADLWIDGVQFRSPLPLSAADALSLGGSTFEVSGPEVVESCSRMGEGI